jgi:hypothetical protein
MASACVVYVESRALEGSDEFFRTNSRKTSLHGGDVSMKASGDCAVSGRDYDARAISIGSAIGVLFSGIDNPSFLRLSK